MACRLDSELTGGLAGVGPVAGRLACLVTGWLADRPDGYLEVCVASLLAHSTVVPY